MALRQLATFLLLRSLATASILSPEIQPIPVQFSPDFQADTFEADTLVSSISPATNGQACKLPAVARTNLGLGFPATRPATCAPSTGTLNAFMFFVDFPDAAATETPESLRDFFVPGAQTWYNVSSYGKLWLNVTAFTSGGFFRMPNDTASYGFQRSLSSANHQKYIQDALALYLKNNTLPNMDVLYIVPTKAATKITFSPTMVGGVRTRAGVTVAKGAVTFGADAFQTWKYKVVNHETGHTMCLPDMYAENDNGKWTGGYDMMAYILGASPDYFAWSKWFLGWITDDQIDCITASGSSTHTVSPLEVDPISSTDIKAVVVKINATTALVAEVRSKNGNDAGACTTGVLLYTVSTNINSLQGPVRIFDTKPNSGGCARDEKNDAPLTLNGNYTVPGLNVKVAVTAQTGDTFTFTVDVP